MNCDMCGKEARLFKTDVEGSMLNLCQNCSKFGKVISAVTIEVREVRKKAEVKSSKKEELILSIVPDYGSMIKKKREKMGIKQEDFAKKLNEKASLIHKIEVGHFEPQMGLARKIEKFLHIRLIEQQELKPEKISGTKGNSFTIGDFIKVKK